MKEEMIRLANHYKKVSETASGMVAKNAKIHYDQLVKGHPYVLVENKPVEKK